MKTTIFKRISTLFVLIGAGALVATACGAAASAAPVPKAAHTSKAVTTVSVWSWTPVTSTMQEMAASFHKKHPAIQIAYKIEPNNAYLTSLAAAAASGTMPDLIGLSPGAETQEYRSKLIPLDSVATSLWGKDWRSHFPSALLEEALFGNPKGNSQTYIIPEEAETIGIWYNKEIFAKLHIRIPSTLSQMINDSAKMTRAGYIGFYEGGGVTLFDEWVYMQIAAQTDLKGLMAAERGGDTWTQPGMIRAATIWKEMSQKLFQPGAMSALQYPTGADLFAAGRVGMISLGSWWLQEVKLPGAPALAKKMDFGYFNLPSVAPGLKRSPVLGGVDFGWGITKTAAKSTKELKATETVLKSFISGVGETQAVNTLNDLPAFEGIHPTVKFSPQVTSLFKSLSAEVTKAYPHTIGSTAVFNALVANLQDVATGTETPRAAMVAVAKVAR